ncbi:16S rRNA (guanine(966)-N(2))-methyltransferase RsmD [Chitinibacter bivalviorum]|uniref:16S rRNA (Guanine(966)-N(2))-methyltransferase RsmD n=1 Tax=Chitinibacter bivalviorum TaxID=2739434 RepID=A0A7H9BLW3_9NEIS|nr:16S rRNA (guanine(966)-N(2))-methyltransferase RsmD [Chitinibacter bivalviorum]QLG89422.1 16S rRNA (guanine(966)-N(2))-methyltransferase RsmD [Chitinibacter bivalviorum]
MSAQHKNQVRIIGGQYKRRILKFPDALALRPTPDRVRETVFNWLGQDLTGQACLDLFAGSGALGFEAASRNAKLVTMIEMAKPVHAALKANAEVLKANHVHIILSDAERFLERNTSKFDLILLDPPYATPLLGKVLPKVIPFLNEEARVYIECAEWPDLTGWEILREGKAGTVKFAVICRASVDDQKISDQIAE